MLKKRIDGGTQNIICCLAVTLKTEFQRGKVKVREQNLSSW